MKGEAAVGRLRTAGEAMALAVAGALLGRRFPPMLRDMQRAQWLPEAELQARAQPHLARLLQHAAVNVPFYRDTYRRLGLAPDGLRTPADLQRLPIAGKATFRQEAPDRFLAANIAPHAATRLVTSGSTGEPFSFVVDRNKLPIIFASHLFYDSWYGLRPFTRGVRIGSPSSPPSRPSRLPVWLRLRQDVSRRLQHAYERFTQTKIPVWSFDEPQAEEIHRRLEALQPAYIYSGASTLAALADILLRRNLVSTRPAHGIVSIAETLTPTRRRLIEAYFKAPIINRYGLREQGYWCAQSCPEAPEQFHVNTELVVLEVVRPDGSPSTPGEVGRVLVTDLFNYRMPFIRYDTGDLSAWATGPCPCGRGFPRLGPIEGRSYECIQTPSGRVITPARWSHFLFVHKTEYAAAVSHYQLEWHPPNRARLLIVPAASFEASAREGLRKDLAWLLGPEVAVSVETVSEIRPEKSGKRPIVKVVRPHPETSPATLS